MKRLTQNAKLIIRTQAYCCDLEDCYREGYLSAQRAQGENTNPYVTARKSLEHQYWLDGWWDGFYQAAPAFALNIALADQPHHTRLKDTIKWLKQKHHWQWTVGIAAIIAAVGLTTYLISEAA